MWCHVLILFSFRKGDDHTMTGLDLKLSVLYLFLHQLCNSKISSELVAWRKRLRKGILQPVCSQNMHFLNSGDSNSGVKSNKEHLGNLLKANICYIPYSINPVLQDMKEAFFPLWHGDVTVG